jgi:hypothetical protein
MKLVILIVIVLAVGCSSQSVVLEPSVQSYEKINLKNNENLSPINLVRVINNTGEETLGEARTGAQYRKTPVLASESPEKLAELLLTKAFQDQRIIFDESSPYHMKVTINKLWLSEVLERNEAAKCELELYFEMSHESKTTSSLATKNWNNTTKVTYQSQGDLQDATEKLAPTLTTCINIAVEKVVGSDDFIPFLKM